MAGRLFFPFLDKARLFKNNPPSHTYANIRWRSLPSLFAKAGRCKKEGTSHSQPQRYCVYNCKQAFHTHSSHTHLRGRYTCTCKAGTGFRQAVHLVPRTRPSPPTQPQTSSSNSQDWLVPVKRNESHCTGNYFIASNELKADNLDLFKRHPGYG